MLLELFVNTGPVLHAMHIVETVVNESLKISKETAERLMQTLSSLDKMENDKNEKVVHESFKVIEETAGGMVKTLTNFGKMENADVDKIEEGKKRDTSKSINSKS